MELGVGSQTRSVFSTVLIYYFSTFFKFIVVYIFNPRIKKVIIIIIIIIISIITTIIVTIIKYIRQNIR